MNSTTPTAEQLYLPNQQQALPIINSDQAFKYYLTMYIPFSNLLAASLGLYTASLNSTASLSSTTSLNNTISANSTNISRRWETVTVTEEVPAEEEEEGRVTVYVQQAPPSIIFITQAPAATVTVVRAPPKVVTVVQAPPPPPEQPRPPDSNATIKHDVPDSCHKVVGKSFWHPQWIITIHDDRTYNFGRCGGNFIQDMRQRCTVSSEKCGFLEGGPGAEVTFTTNAFCWKTDIYLAFKQAYGRKLHCIMSQYSDHHGSHGGDVHGGSQGRSIGI